MKKLLFLLLTLLLGVPCALADQPDRSFDDVWFCDEDYIAVRQNDLYGLMDFDGNMILPCQWAEMSEPWCGLIGVKRPEDMALLKELASLLGGEIASTRAVVEAGWLDAKRQIGLSGRTVKPKLIITCGVSGAIQFVAGMSGSETIVAINTDPKASIFKVAHVGLVGDLYTIIPELIARIKAKKEAK